MTIDDLKKKYVNAYRFSKETGISSPSFYNWVKWGRIPLSAQYKLEVITKGELKSDENYG